MLGTWVVLRRLPFYTHAIGTATFPGLVVAGPWGDAGAAHRAGRARSGSAACSSGCSARAGSTRTPRSGCCSSRRWRSASCWPATSTTSGAGVDRLLFGSLIALTPLDLWLTAAAAVAALACDARAAPLVARDRLRPDGARAVGVRTALADRALLLAVAVAVVVALDAVGALLVTVVLTVPAATVRLFEPALRTPAARDVRARPRSRACRDLDRRRVQRRPRARRWPCSARSSTASRPRPRPGAPRRDAGGGVPA